MENATSKNSKALWFGKIPETWSLATISSFYELRNEKVSDKDYPPLSVTMNGIVPRLESAAKTDNGDNRKLVRKGDFAINSRSDRRGSCGVSEYDGSVSLINTVLMPKGEMHSGYYNWLFHTVAFSDEFYKWGHGIVDDLWTTRWQEMKQIIIPVPSLTIQSAIADYLDNQCAKIDSLIEETKVSIEDYKKWRASLIYEVVTKGMDPNVEMKDSGIEWIGRMPANWEIKKLKHLANSKTKRSETNYNYIGLENIESESGQIIQKIDETIDTNGSSISVNAGDVIFGKLRPYLAKCAVMEKEGCCSTEFIVLTPSDLTSNYLKYCMLSPKFVDFVNMSTYGTKMPRANWDFIGNIPMPVPKHIEQDKIVEYLDKRCKIINNLMIEKKQIISNLVAYKKSLIYETVTGKRKVV